MKTNKEQLKKNLEAQRKMLVNRNLIEATENDKAIINKKFRDLWSGEDWSTLIREWRLYGGGCIHCGGDITSRVLDFFHFEVEMVSCYKCQEIERNNF